MKIIKVKDEIELGIKASELVKEVLKSKTNPVLGLATGSTPETMYEQLVAAYQNGEISFKNVVTFNLDEYVGLDEANEFSYHYYMNEKLFDHVDIDKKNTYIPNGNAEDLEAECAAFESAIQEHGPIDLQILGVGLNGHIGFNEPGTPFTSRTHVATLEESTRKANSRFFTSLDEVPKYALTMGLATIMDAKKIVLLVQGEHKKAILHEIVHGDVTEEVPASVLKLHPDVVVITDLDV